MKSRKLQKVILKDTFQQVEHTFLWERDGWISSLVLALIVDVLYLIVAIFASISPVSELGDSLKLSDGQLSIIAVILFVIEIIRFSY